MADTAAETTKKTTDSKADSGLETQGYELGYLIDPTITEDKVAEVVGKIVAVIEKNGGIVGISESPKMRMLAYMIEKSVEGKRNKYTQSYFGWTRFSVLPEVVPVIEKEVQALASVVRHLLTIARRDRKKPMKPGSFVRKERKTDTPEPGAPKMSEAELDQKVDELIASTTQDKAKAAEETKEVAV